MADTTKNRPKWLTDLIGTVIYGYNGTDRATYDREQETGLSGLELAQHDYAMRNGGSTMYGTPDPLTSMAVDYATRTNQGGGPQIYGSPSSPSLANDIRDLQGGFTVKSTTDQPTNPNSNQTDATPKDTNPNPNPNPNPSSPKQPTAGSSPVKTPVSEAAPQYQGTYQEQIDQILQEIMSGGEFKYDFAVDPIFQQYAERYNRNGQLAMMDTMAQAAAMTGGYGSTYGQQVGQQAYNGYMQDLNAVIPDLYEMAYDRYLAENDRKRNNLALLQGMDEIEYNRFMDNLAFDYQKAQDDREFYAKYPHLAPGYQKPKPSPGGGGGNGGNDGITSSIEQDLANAAVEFANQNPTLALDSRWTNQFVSDYVADHNYPEEAADILKEMLALQGMSISPYPSISY